jgi:hypothetical protein
LLIKEDKLKLVLRNFHSRCWAPGLVKLLSGVGYDYVGEAILCQVLERPNSLF